MIKFIVFLFFGLRNPKDHRDLFIVSEGDITCFTVNYFTIMKSNFTYCLRVTPKSSLASYASSPVADTSDPQSVVFDHCSDIKTCFITILFLNLKRNKNGSKLYLD